jgi:hypothetical protein
MSLKVKHWSTFQHYRDRRPPWVKLHRGLLDDIDYAMLDPMAAKCLPLIWLLASETSDGLLPDIKVLAFRLRITEAQCSKVISALAPWVEQDASTMLASCQQDACPETETETEAEREAEREADKSKKRYGEFKNVHLTDDEHSKLTERMGVERLESGINILDAYIEQKGRRYKSHFAVMKEGGWVWERVHKDKPAPVKADYSNGF